MQTWPIVVEEPIEWEGQKTFGVEVGEGVRSCFSVEFHAGTLELPFGPCGNTLLGLRALLLISMYHNPSKFPLINSSQVPFDMCKVSQSYGLSKSQFTKHHIFDPFSEYLVMGLTDQEENTFY